MFFLCVACFSPSKSLTAFSGREGSNCVWCNATARDRAMLINIHLNFLKLLLKKPGKIPKIVGVSDGYLVEKVLKKIYRSRYTNYHYHQEPKLNISDVPRQLYEIADIISCSDVLEHVSPPIGPAFEGLKRILKAEGSLILSVPHGDSSSKHLERFPDMKSYEIIYSNDPILRVVLPDGSTEEFSNLVFHGGVGSTVEFRIFSQESLEKGLTATGFKNFRRNRNIRMFGIVWEPWSRVWIVKKG